MQYNNGTTANLRMNNETYALRRKVMNMIYDARAIVTLPRITVRITENHNRQLGCAWINHNVLWISERAITGYNDTILRSIVYHEILHAVFGTEHDESCILMSSAINTEITESDCYTRFRYWSHC